MSAAESETVEGVEAVEVDVAPSDVVGEGAQSGPDALESSDDSTLDSLLGMLQSTEPAESPAEAEGTFASGVSWHQHAEVGFKKATSSRGTPAWLNLVMAAILGIVQGGDGGETGTGVEAEQAGEVA